MYGLIIENVLGYLRSHFHPMRFDEIVRLSKLPFEDGKPDIEKVYPDGIIPKIGKKASQVLQVSEPEIFEGVGVYFVTVTTGLGLRNTLTAIGRNFRDFIFNLDNCHDYFKLQFTRMRAPSFFVDQEHEHGLTLHYRSKRRGFAYYVIGQMKEIAKVIFGLKIDVKIKRQEVVFDTVVVTYVMEFDNSPYVKVQETLGLQNESSLPIRAHVIFEIFPFSILFTENLNITLIGASLRVIMPSIIGQPLNECFDLVRPLVEFNAEQFLARTNNVFVFRAILPPSRVKKARHIELQSKKKSKKPKEGEEPKQNGGDEHFLSDDEDNDEENPDDRLEIRGILTYMTMWKKILFIGCPCINGLNSLVANGLFINDLSMHDYSRDLMITSSQYDMEEKMTKLLLERKETFLASNAEKTEKLKTSNEEIAKGWIPHQVNLRYEEPNVTKVEFAPILMARLDKMEQMSRKSDPVDLIDLLDDISRVFDHLVETIGVLNVETVEGLLAVADYTACLRDETLVDKIATLALDLSHAAQAAFREPNRGKPLKFRVSVVAGPVVAAVIGKKLSKFGIFGTTVSDADRMLDFCSPGKIIIDKNLKTMMHPAYKFSTVTSNANLDCLYVEEKVNHISISVIPVLHAYSSFKAATRKNLLAGIANDEDAVNDLEDNKVEVVDWKKCSHACNIL